ncbi:phage tail tube protein [Azohydromonas lata]|uniref:phage tail tube protein n=1 Tax=Azohydromonas lata TaxID=45677 RepID=UPI00082F6673|nr:phage tail tube protein [Azohydromonas lata]
MPTVPTGTIYAVATAFASSKTVTAISNATEAVVSSTAHGYSNGDYVEITTGWGRLNKRAFRVKSVATDTFTLEGANTTNTEFFPSGSSAGTVRKVTTWQQISKIMNPQSSGGDPKNITYKYLESDVEFTKNDGFTAVQESFEIDADEIGGASYTALVALTEVQSDTILKKTLKSGSIILTPSTIALNENVRMQDGQINRCVVSVAANNRVTRYQS